MAEQKRIDFLNAFMTVWEVHKSGEPSERLIDAYWAVLEKYDIDEIQAAFSYALGSLQWFPKPATLGSDFYSPQLMNILPAFIYSLRLIFRLSTEDSMKVNFFYEKSDYL